MALKCHVVTVGGLGLMVVLTATQPVAVGQEPFLGAFDQAFSLGCDLLPRDLGATLRRDIGELLDRSLMISSLRMTPS